MSVVKIYTINCDLPIPDHPEPGCPRWVAQEHLLKDARLIARSYGWKRHNGNDYCPIAFRKVTGK